jgi:hypothetical protein
VDFFDAETIATAGAIYVRVSIALIAIDPTGDPNALHNDLVYPLMTSSVDSYMRH